MERFGIFLIKAFPHFSTWYICQCAICAASPFIFIMMDQLVAWDKKQMTRSILLIIFCTCAKVFTHADFSNISILDQQSSRGLAAQSERPCARWGNTFDVPLNSKNLLRPCKLPDGRAVCCSALMNYTKSDSFSKPVGWNFHPSNYGAMHERREIIEESNSRVGKNEKCTLEKQYISSPQELRDFAKAMQISALSVDYKDPKRFEALINYVFSDEVVTNSTKWLIRVHEHMTSDSTTDHSTHKDDWEFLSRFEFTRKCGNSVEKWIEWIEPITIPARHPFGFGRCRPVKPYLKPGTPNTGRSDVDYVLLQSGKGLFDQTYHRNGRRVLYEDSNNQMGSNNMKRHQYTPIKHFMLDAGTSTFDSSLFWFTCAYSQVCHLIFLCTTSLLSIYLAKSWL